MSTACTPTEDSCELIVINQVDETDAARDTLPAPQLSYSVGLHYQWTFSGNNVEEQTIDVTFCIDALNEPPVAQSDTYTVDASNGLTLDDTEHDDDCGIVSSAASNPSLFNNDTDDRHLGGPCLTAELMQKPLYAANDFASSFTAEGGFSYQPDIAQFNSDLAYDQATDQAKDQPGTDSFSYRLFDGTHYSEEATVLLLLANEKTRPVANYDVYTARRNSRQNPFAILKNDSDPQGLPLFIDAITEQPDRGGTVTILPDQSIFYTPAAGVTGVEYFSYAIVIRLANKRHHLWRFACAEGLSHRGSLMAPSYISYHPDIVS